MAEWPDEWAEIEKIIGLEHKERLERLANGRHKHVLFLISLVTGLARRVLALRRAITASPPPQAPVGSPQPCVCCGTFDTPRRDGYCPDCYPHPPKPDVTYWFVEAYRDGEATGVWLGRDGRSVTRDPLEAMRFTDKTKAQDSAIACVGTPLFDLARWYVTDHLFWPLTDSLQKGQDDE
jgi:hypothetical protein